MTGRVFEIKRFAVHDGDGIRTTVFLKGCPLRCVWCHNPEGLRGEKELALYDHKCVRCGACAAVCPNGAHEVTEKTHLFHREKCLACGRCAPVCPNGALTLYGRDVEADALLPELLADRDFYEASGGGVTLSGGECLLQADFCRELLMKLKEAGIGTAVDTAGDLPWENFEKVLPFTDTFLYDVKAASPGLHRSLTGAENGRILENLRRLSKRGADIEARVIFVPGKNEAEMPAVADLLAGLSRPPRVRLLAYHDLARSKYRALSLSDEAMPAAVPTAAQMEALAALFRSRGLTIVG